MSEIEFSTVEKSFQRKKVDNEPKFAGMLDSEAHTPNGGTMTLHVTTCPDIKKGEKAKVTVDIIELDREFIRDNKVVSEGSDDDLLATFEGYLENRDGTFIFSEMKPTEEADLTKGAFLPYFYISFAAEGYTVGNTSKPTDPENSFLVMVGQNKEENEGNEYEIGFVIKKDGTEIGSSGKTASFFDGEYSTYLPLGLFNTRTDAESAGLVSSTCMLGSYDSNDFLDDKERSVAEASTTGVYSSTFTALAEKKLKAVDAALKKIDNLVKTSKNPYFQNIEAVNEYYRKLTVYKGHLEEYHKMQKSGIYTSGDIQTMAGMLYTQAKELNRLEEEITGYLSSARHPPVAYQKKIEHYAEIIKRNKEIDRFLNNPAVQLIGLLPGAGVVTGSLKLLQGKTFDGFLDIFGSIISYGSFIKLSRVARAYNRASKNTVEMLYSYRYRNLVSQITTNSVMNKITGMSLNNADAFLGKLFSTVGSFKSLKGCINDIALLHKHRKIILDLTEKTIKGMNNGIIRNADDYINFLRNLGYTNVTMEYFACLRLAHGSYQAGKDAYDSVKGAFNEVQQLLGHKVPGSSEFDSTIISKSLDMFEVMNDNGIKIDEVLSGATRQFPSNIAIVEYFNNSYNQNDNFGLHLNADVRYQNTRDEMLLALEDITDSWEGERSARDSWIKENRQKFNRDSERIMQIIWAKNKKAAHIISLEGSLEIKIKNFQEKIKGQIELRENLQQYNAALNVLVGIVRDGTAPESRAIFDLDITEYCKSATELIDTYY